jgi:hypothetical protein
MAERRTFNYWPTGIAAAGPNDVWFRNYYPYRSFTHYDGADWTLEYVTLSPVALWGMPGAGVFLLGFAGEIYQHR